MKRIATFFNVILAALAVSISLWRRAELDQKLDRAGFGEYATSTARTPGWAPVQLWWEAPPEVKGEWRARKAARISILRGEAFVGGMHIPRKDIRTFLDARVTAGVIDYVVIFPEKSSRWGDIFPIVDECRRSSVRIVFLNQFES